MKIVKYITLTILCIIAFEQCTEIYIPDISSNTTALVVEGLITNGEGPFSVKLTEAIPYNSNQKPSSNCVTGATVFVSDSLNNIFHYSESDKGVYTLPSDFRAVIGKSYKLHIETTDGSIYESGYEKLLPLQDYDSIRGFLTSQKYIDKNNTPRLVTGADLRVDLFGSQTSLKSPLCRFESDITVQYNFTYNMPDTTDWHFVVFGWETFNVNSTANITEQKATASSSYIKNHSLGFIPIGTMNYGFNTPENSTSIYYLRINQYTLNQSAYNFYKDGNTQLSGSGKIFDPVSSQLYGNMKCINNASKVVLGLFEVSSVTRSAYVVDAIPVSNRVYLFKAPFVQIGEVGLSRYRVWDADLRRKPEDDPNYDEIPLPYWWYHTNASK